MTRYVTKYMRENPLISFFVLAIAGSWIIWAPWYLSRNGMGFIGTTFSDTTITFINVIGMFLGPFLAALVVSRIADGPGAPLALISRMIQWRENPIWYVTALVAIPVACGAGYITLIGKPGTPSVAWSLAMLFVAFFAAFALGPIQEEIGWRGFALPRLQKLVHPALAATLLGLFVFLWQLPTMVTWAWRRPFYTFTDVGVYALFLIAVSIVFCAMRNLAHGSLLFPILGYATFNWTLFAAPMMGGEPLDNLFPATFGMWILALAALLLTGGRLGAGTPEAHDTPLVELAEDLEAKDAARI